MAKIIDIVVPEGVADATVVEIMQQLGAQVAEDDSLIAVETDKAIAEVPAPQAGKLLEWSVQNGDMVSSGVVIGKLEVAAAGETTEAASEEPKENVYKDIAAAGSQNDEIAAPQTLLAILVPDGVENAIVVEIMQQLGAEVTEDESLIAVETDKATAEVPAPQAGRIAEWTVKVGDTVSSGDLIGRLQVQNQAKAQGSQIQEQKIQVPAASQPPAQSAAETVAFVAIPTNSQRVGALVHASPSLRQFARELGVDLHRIEKPSGPKGRITFDDVKGLVKAVMRGAAESGHAPFGAGIPRIELPDFSQFGAIEEQSLSNIKQISGQHLTKGWLNIPLVTHFEEADITELENFRKALNSRPAVAKGNLPKTTPLAFIVRTVVKALQQYPQVNSSLSEGGKSLIVKKYYNIGIAVDTPRGLLVPVIFNADRLSLDDISSSIKELGAKGRAGKLGPADMAGGSFTISSLGSLGGTNFTPLVNPPEAAILGVAKSAMKPLWNGKEFAPRLILPFSVSYDHRILDGGEVARFGATLAGYLKDLRYILV